MDTNLEQVRKAWLASRPESVQRLAEEFPIGSVFCIEGEVLYLLGYTEDDMLIVTAIDPDADYPEAFGSKKYICASHLRTGSGPL